MTIRVDISIGPVQGFVAQSRRTRDLWGSSYLLSFLSAHAMRGAEDAGGEVLQPLVSDAPLFQWASGNCVGDPPRVGTLPNHFTVEVNGEPRHVASAARDAFDSAWAGVCDAVWDRYVAGAASLGNDTRAIWERQVSAFWDFSWAAGPKDDHDLLARRKHWRSHRPPDEPGDKCTVMHDLQELSGYARARDRTRQEDFWERVYRRMGLLDLQNNERLCAVALVKRLFPRVAKEAVGWDVDVSHWPSTVDVAALPWLRRVVNAVPDAVGEYAERVGRAAREDVFPMQRPPFEGLETTSVGKLPKLDANYFHRDFVLNRGLCPLEGEDTRGELADMLRNICESEDAEGKLGSPSKFYALLLADGDRLGKLVSEAGSEAVSKALSKFTDKVPNIVGKHDGVTIYAGGDDMLAMLPVDKALACADALAKTYPDSFDVSAQENATLSAAVVFAHVRQPLRYVLREARTQLDDVAKGGNGRSSVVVAVLKPGGMYCQWVTTWNRQGQDGDAHAVEQLERLSSNLARSDSDKRLSSSLLYRIRDTLSLLCGWDRWEPGAWGDAPEGVDLSTFLRAEIHRSLDAQHGATSGRSADELTRHVCDLLEQSRNPGTDDAGVNPQSLKVGVDALLLARFLANPYEVDGRW